jgi:hypothetical protein
MHGGEQFQSKRRFEAFHEATDPLEAFAHLWLLIQNSSGIVDGAGYQFQHLVRLVAAISEARNIVALDCTEDVAKIFGAGSVWTLREPQAERLTGFLQEVHQFVHLKQGNERIEQADQVTFHQDDHCCTSGRHRGNRTPAHASWQRLDLSRFEDEDANVGESRQRLFNARAHLRPLQTAQPAAQGRQSHRAYAATLDFLNKSAQPRLDILNARFPAPVPLGGEVDDVAWEKIPGLEDEHSAGLNLLPTTGSGISLEVFRPVLLELQRNAAPHHSNTVDGVYQGLNLGFEDVSGYVFDHGLLLCSKIPVVTHFNARSITTPCQHAAYFIPDISTMHTNPLNEIERKEAIDKKFCLFPLLDIGITEIRRRNGIPIEFVKIAQIRPKLRIAGARIRE